MRLYLEEVPTMRRRPSTAMLAVESWFASNDTAFPFTFLNVCDALGLEASAVRRALAHRRHAIAREARALGRR